MELAEQVAGTPEPEDGAPFVNLALQAANTLLHDGHAWKRLDPDEILASTRRAVEDRQSPFLVHASCAFLGAVEEGGRPGRRLKPIVDSLRQAEAMVLESGRPACVVRLGYHYGPRSRDLRLYRRAFRLGRPYLAGPARRLQPVIHQADAARALRLAAAG